MVCGLFDTHAHYDDDAYDGDRDSLLSGLSSKGVAHVINIGYDIDSSEASRALSSQYDFIRFAAGVHPHNAADAPPDFENALTRLLDDERAVALGEIGLDYYYDHSPRNIQKEIFARQLTLAGKLGIPVIIHDRDAHSDIIDMLRAHGDTLSGGVLHSVWRRYHV